MSGPKLGRQAEFGRIQVFGGSVNAIRWVMERSPFKEKLAKQKLYYKVRVDPLNLI